MRDGDATTTAESPGAIGAAWAVGLIVDDADIAIALAVGGSLLLVLAVEIVPAAYAGAARQPRS